MHRPPSPHLYEVRRLEAPEGLHGLPKAGLPGSQQGATETALDELKTCWGSSIRIVLKSWRSKWENLSVYFKYPPDIRRVIYITSAMRRGIGSFASSPKPRGPSPMRTTC